MKHIIKTETFENLPKTRPLIAKDAEGNLVYKQETKIWYTTTDGEIYDLKSIIEILKSKSGTYNGPDVVSNEYNKKKQMYCMTFIDDVSILGDIDFGTMTAEGPFFITYSDPDINLNLECNVETIILPKTITSIGQNAFYQCTGLTSINIPNRVKNIGDRAFNGCTSLTSVTIGNSVTNIGYYAFYHCSKLTSITIPNKVTSIRGYAFNGCNGLTSVNISDIAAWCKIAFNNSYANPLYYAHNLYLNGTLVTDLVIPDGVTSINKSAFHDCHSLTSVTIGNSVTSIGISAFYFCTRLTSVTIPNSVTSIESFAFKYCSSLTSVTIPNNVTIIGNEAFGDCTSLTSITCEATTPPTIQSNTFNSVNKNIPVYVPAGSIESYNAANYWNEFNNIQKIPE